jgi:hypothetical protein
VLDSLTLQEEVERSNKELMWVPKRPARDPPPSPGQRVETESRPKTFRDLFPEEAEGEKSEVSPLLLDTIAEGEKLLSPSLADCLVAEVEKNGGIMDGHLLGSNFGGRYNKELRQGQGRNDGSFRKYVSSLPTLRVVPHESIHNAWNVELRARTEKK